jgi:SAM-dependent methyltransferase
MYDPGYMKDFYNEYGNAEWERLERTAFGRLQTIIHNDFLKRYVKSNDRVLDAGCGPGRFIISLANLGAKVTALDLSDGQLELAKQKLLEADIIDKVEDFVQADISDLSMYPDGCFDAVVCYGGVLSYVCEKRQQAASELVRVVKNGGVLLVSVMSLIGSACGVAIVPQIDMLESPDEMTNGKPPLWPVLESGDLEGFPSRKGLRHAPMHLYKADELRELFKDCEILEMAGSNVTMHEHSQVSERIAASPAAWATLVELERRLCREPGLLDSGSHIIMAARR